MTGLRGWAGLLGAAYLLVLLGPGAAEAQWRRDGWRRANAWSFAPYGGAFKDAFDASPDGKDTGWLVGFRLGFDLGGRTRLTGNVGYAESDDVTSGPVVVNRLIYDDQYIITTGGAEYDILPGNSGVSLGAEAGGLWRKTAFDRRLGGGTVDQPPGDDGYAFYFVAVPALTVRHGFSPRTALELSVRDFIQPDDRVEHFPAVTLGFRFR